MELWICTVTCALHMQRAMCAHGVCNWTDAMYIVVVIVCRSFCVGSGRMSDGLLARRCCMGLRNLKLSAAVQGRCGLTGGYLLLAPP